MLAPFERWGPENSFELLDFAIWDFYIWGF